MFAAPVLDQPPARGRLPACRAASSSGAIFAWTSAFYEFERCEGTVGVKLYLLSDMGHEWPEPLDDLRDARRWADVISTTTIAMVFCETYAR